MGDPIVTQFIHHYGCEPYASNSGAGGATLTEQNLVITAWGGTEAQASGDGDLSEVFEDATLLTPNPDNTALDAFTRAACRQGFHSRHSAHTFVQQGDSKQDATIMPVGYVLNPPPEFKQDMAQALSYNGGAVLDYASWTANKSLMSQYAWRYAVEDVQERDSPSNANGATLLITRAAYSTYLHLPSLAPGDTYRLPFLKTSGADGVKPLFFDPSTVGGAQEMVAAVNLGNFFVFMELAADVPGKFAAPAAQVNHTIVWPHSAARG